MNIDVAESDRKIWLMKVPRSVGTKWKESEDGELLGNILTSPQQAGGMREFQFVLSDKFTTEEDDRSGGGQGLPGPHSKVKTGLAWRPDQQQKHDKTIGSTEGGLKGVKAELYQRQTDTSSHLMTPHPTSSHLMTPHHTSSHLMTPQHTSSQPTSSHFNKYKLKLTRMEGRHWHALKYDCSTLDADEAANKRCKIMGYVNSKIDLQPIKDDSQLQRYVESKKASINRTKASEKVTVQTNFVPVYKPRSYQPHELDNKKAKGSLGEDASTRVRLDKNEVMELLFKAFEKHQYYQFKDLVRLTNQPAQHLKEILTEICVYNTTAQHRFMWELKPQYRHYN